MLGNKTWQQSDHVGTELFDEVDIQLRIHFSRLLMSVGMSHDRGSDTD